MIYLALICVAQLAILAFVLLEQRRNIDQIRMMVEHASPDLCEMVALVDRLCQRIQAPEVAIAEHASGVWSQDDALPSVDMFDDDDFHESKEDLAERLDREAQAQVGSA